MRDGSRQWRGPGWEGIQADRRGGVQAGDGFPAGERFKGSNQGVGKGSRQWRGSDRGGPNRINRELAYSTYIHTVMSTQPAAPSFLLSFIRCGCKADGCNSQ